MFFSPCLLVMSGSMWFNKKKKKKKKKTQTRFRLLTHSSKRYVEAFI